MNVYDTVLRSIQYSPMLDQTREEVLHHLFFVNGNAMKWGGGQLVYDGYDDPETYKQDPIEYQRNWYREQYGRYGFLLGPLEQYIEDNVAGVIPIIETAEERAKPGFPKDIERWRRQFPEKAFPEQYEWNADRIYPLCRYANIFHVPDDVQDDWLMAAAEAINIVRELGRGIAHPYNLDFLEVAREDLMARFPEKLANFEWVEIGPGLDPDTEYAEYVREKHVPKTEEQRKFREKPPYIQELRTRLEKKRK